ncbi:MAG: hypothetical protein KGM95_10365, partial [Betaproteobacteria bacterium]|nr:hypothetical protein [Betaproteobacteria bacterium]
SGFVAWTLWRQAGSELSAARNTMIHQAANNIRGAGVDEGQTRFLAMLGMMSSSLFIVAIIFTCCAVLLVSPCSAWF